MRSSGFGVKESVASYRGPTAGVDQAVRIDRKVRRASGRRGDSLRVPVESWTSGIRLPLDIHAARTAAPHSREARHTSAPPAYTLAHTCTLRPTRQRPSCPRRLLRLLAPPYRAERPDRLLTWGEGGARCARATGRGAPRCLSQGSAQSVCARVRRAEQRRPGSGKLPAEPGLAQRAEGARRRSGGFARFLMGRICSGL